MKPITLALCLIGLTATAQAQSLSEVAPDALVNPAKVEDVKYGLVCPGGPVQTLPAPDTYLGYITQRDDWQKVEYTTQTVPLIKGIGFGVDVSPRAGGEMRGVEVTITHPPYKGTQVRRESWLSDVTQDNFNLNFFLFEHDFEMVPGDWTFEASHDGEMLFSVEFKVVPPARAPHLTGICKGPGQLS